MLTMILKMSAVTGLNIVLTYVIWRILRDKKLGIGQKILLGIIYGGCAVLSTHFGVDYKQMMLNVRDLSPLTAGLFFDPVSGVIAGLIGGIERYIAGTYFDVTFPFSSESQNIEPTPIPHENIARNDVATLSSAPRIVRAYVGNCARNTEPTSQNHEIASIEPKTFLIG